MLRQVVSNGEQVIIGGNGALVASNSQPGYWHCVRNGACDCKGFQYHGHCRHVKAVEVLNKTAEPILAGPAIDPELFPASKPWTRPAPKTFEELFPQYA